MKQNLTRKQVVVFSFTGMTGQTGITGLIFFCQESFFEALGKGVARGPQSKCCFTFLG